MNNPTSLDLSDFSKRKKTSNSTNLDQVQTVEKLINESETDLDFYIRLTISTLVITLGLILNSPSVVIGGMLFYIGLDINRRRLDKRRAKQRVRALAEKELEGYEFVDESTS